MKRMIQFAALLVSACLLAAGIQYGFRQGAIPEAEDSAAGIGLMLVEDAQGLYVLAVTQDSPADKAGVRPGDYLLSAGGQALDSAARLETLLEGDPPLLQLLIRRNGQALTVVLRMNES